MAKNEQQQEQQDTSVIYVLNPAANLGGYAFSDGKSILAGQRYLASEEEYAERSKARTTRSDGSTVAVVVKDS